MALRPGFALDVAMPSRHLIDQLAGELERGTMTLKRTRHPGGGGVGTAGDSDHLVLTVPEAEQHFWSPWLTVEVSARESGTHVNAKFSPHPSVWTGFAFGYLTMTVLLAVSLVVAATAFLVPGGGQLWVLWVSLGAALGIAGLWWSSQIGQRLAHDQMVALRSELDRALSVIAPSTDPAPAAETPAEPS
jgi:hypothetical protein